MGFKHSYRDGWVWDDGDLPKYATTWTSMSTGDPIEIPARNTWTGDPIINSPITAVEPSVTPTYAQGWVCPKCGRANAPWVATCQCTGSIFKKIDTWTETGIPEACRNCSNHPSNGGSGICLCTLGTPKITC